MSAYFAKVESFLLPSLTLALLVAAVGSASAQTFVTAEGTLVVSDGPVTTGTPIVIGTPITTVPTADSGPGADPLAADPYVIHRLYTDDPEADLNLFTSILEPFEDSDGSHPGFGFSTEGWGYLHEDKAAVLELLGFSIDDLEIAPISDDTRDECEESAKVFSVVVYGQVYEIEIAFDDVDDLLDILLGLELSLNVEYATWDYYPYSWSDDFWHCSTFGWGCPGLIQALQCEPSSTCGGTYCPSLSVEGSAYWDYDTNPLELTFHYGLIKVGDGQVVMEADTTEIGDVWAALINALVGEALGEDENPFEMFSAVFGSLVDNFVQVWATSSYTVPLPFDLSGTAVAWETEVSIDPTIQGIESDYLDVWATVDFEGTYALPSGTAYTPTLDSSSAYRYGMGVPDSLVNDILFAGFVEGVYGWGASGTTDDFIDLLPDLPSGLALSWSVDVGTAPAVDFNSDLEPWLVFEDAQVELLLEGLTVLSLSADVAVLLVPSVSSDSVVVLTPEWRDVEVVLGGVTAFGPLASSADRHFENVAAALAEDFLTDDLYLVKHAFWANPLLYPAEDIRTYETVGGWLNLYLE